jgi:hypothetical protein
MRSKRSFYGLYTVAAAISPVLLTLGVSGASAFFKALAGDDEVPTQSIVKFPRSLEAFHTLFDIYQTTFLLKNTLRIVNFSFQ